MKSIIAVDIDDVLAAEAEFVVAYTNEHWGGSYTLEDYTEAWNLFWGVDVDEVERRAEILHRPGEWLASTTLSQAAERFQNSLKRNMN